MSDQKSNDEPSDFISNWWMYHGNPAHTGVATGSSISSETIASFKKIHSLTLDGPVLSVPAIVGGIAYVGIANSYIAQASNGGTIYKIELSSGKILNQFTWSLGTSDGGTEADLEDSHGFTGMGCTPAVVNGFVYFSAFNGRVYCLKQEDLTLVWQTSLRERDLTKNQPITNMRGTSKNPVKSDCLNDSGNVATYSPPAGWSSPLVTSQTIGGKKKDCIYVGIGEGENPYLYSFIFCLDASNGKVNWIFCTNQFEKRRDNKVNELPKSVTNDQLPSMFSTYEGSPVTMGSSPWSSIAYEKRLNRIYVGLGNPKPDGTLPSPGYANGLISLDAQTGEFAAYFQALASSSYRPSDLDVDIGASPTVFERQCIDNALPGTNPSKSLMVVGIGAKNGGYFILDASNLNLLTWRQLLPYYNNGLQIPTVDPHSNSTTLSPQVTNAESNVTMGENYHGTYSCAAVHAGKKALFVGLGGSNYNTVAPGINYETTPFMRAIDYEAMNDIWAFDDNDPKRYKEAMPPMYTTPGECGLSSPAVVNDLVFCSTSMVSLYAFDVNTGKMLWSDRMGDQTGGYKGGFGFCMGPAISGNYVCAGALILGNQTGGVFNIYSLT